LSAPIAPTEKQAINKAANSPVNRLNTIGITLNPLLVILKYRHIASEYGYNQGKVFLESLFLSCCNLSLGGGV
jgi:hypothetical protein